MDANENTEVTMNWNIILQLAVIVMALLGGAATVPVIGWLKSRLGTTGGQTIALAVAVTALLTVAAAILDGSIAPGTIGPDNFGVVFVALFVAGQVRYRQLRDQIGQ